MSLELCGWTPDRNAIESFVATLPRPCYSVADDTERETILPLALLRVVPDWRRVKQGIGDCVSHGYEFGATLLMAQLALRGHVWEGVAATEPIYGGSRVEARGGRLGGYSDGSYGSVAAKWLRDWGVLLRKDYSAITGNADHDLRVYSPKRAKAWGNFGCGGEKDARGDGPLDKVAKLHPVRETTLVTSFAQAAKMIQNGYPVPVCSGQGFTMQRDADGFCAPRGSWAHCMCFAGVRYGRRPGLLCVNSWGASNSGPRYPSTLPDAIAECSFWVDASVVDRMLSQRDSFALADVAGFPKRELDWSVVKFF